MNGTDNPSEMAQDSDSQNLRAELDSLKSMVSFALLVMFVFTLCVDFFLFHERNEMNGQLAIAEQTLQGWQTRGSPQAFEFWKKLNEYASRHPDFMPIISRYQPYISVRETQPAKK